MRMYFGAFSALIFETNPEEIMDKNEHVVVALFGDRAAAEAAIERLKKWDKASDDIKLGAIGLLYKEDGEIKSTIGRQGGRGLRVGALVGVIAGALSRGNDSADGAISSFFAKSLHLNEAECEALGVELELGKAAVVVTCDEYEVMPTRRTLEKAGGAVKVYEVPTGAVDDAAALDEEDLRKAHIAEQVFDDALTKAADDIGGYM